MIEAALRVNAISGSVNSYILNSKKHNPVQKGLCPNGYFPLIQAAPFLLPKTERCKLLALNCLKTGHLHGKSIYK